VRTEVDAADVEIKLDRSFAEIPKGSKVQPPV